MYHYGTSQSGNHFHNSGDGSNLNHIGKPCEGFIHAYGKDFARIGKNETLEVKWHASPPHLLNEDGYYDTGDHVQIREDGNWEFQGRANEMLMIRGGSKLHSPSIEDCLLEHQDVKEAYVYPIPEHDIQDSSMVDLKSDISKEETKQAICIKVQDCYTTAKFHQMKFIFTVKKIYNLTTGQFIFFN